MLDVELERGAEAEDAGRGRAGRGLFLKLLRLGRLRERRGHLIFDAIDGMKRENVRPLRSSLPFHYRSPSYT
jgi:hypothetical protein